MSIIFKVFLSYIGLFAFAMQPNMLLKKLHSACVRSDAEEKKDIVYGHPMTGFVLIVLLIWSVY